jgi:hypothetical protein
MALLLLEESMDANGYECDGDDEPQEEMSAAPADGKADDQRDEEPADEPGYGHGV